MGKDITKQPVAVNATQVRDKKMCKLSRSLTVEAEQVLVLLRRRGHLDDGDGEAVGGCREDRRGQRHVVLVQKLCVENSCVSVSSSEV